MISTERKNWIINIENTIIFIISEIGKEVVTSTLNKYGANTIEQITSADLAEVFNELYAIEVELRSD